MIRVVLRMATLATLGAGLIGLVRQRMEATAVRRGLRPRPSAAADLELDVAYGRVAGRLAEWVPRRPRSWLGRRVTALWASPLTGVGLLIAWLSGGRPTWDDTLGCLVTRRIGGLSALALRTVGAQANTIGQVVLCTTPHPSPTLLAHEAVHVRQAERFGPLLFPVYVWLGARYGYRDHPLERAARLGARRGGGPTGDGPDRSDADGRPAQ